MSGFYFHFHFDSFEVRLQLDYVTKETEYYKNYSKLQANIYTNYYQIGNPMEQSSWIADVQTTTKFPPLSNQNAY